MNDDRKSELDVGQDRAALREALPAAVALVAAQAAIAGLNLDSSTHRWHVVIALSPLVAGIWLAWVQVRILRRCDEYQRTLQLEAMSIGFGVAMLVAMTGGLLDGADVGTSSQYLQITFIVGIVSWVGALAVKMRK